MPVNAIQRTVAIDRETAFGAGVASWTDVSTTRSMLYVIGLNIEGIQQSMLEDENIRRRASDEQPMFLGLKSDTSFSFEMYQYGHPSPAASPGVQGARLGRDDILRDALGGEIQGYAAAITGGTATAPTIEEGNFDSMSTSGWGFFYDVSESVGHFRQIYSITDGGEGNDDTLGFITSMPLPFTPDSGDVIYACVSHYPRWTVLEDHTHADRINTTMLFYGRHAEDTYIVRGCSYSVNIGPFEAGAPVKWTVNGKAATFVNTEDNVQPAMTGVPSGQHGPVVGSGQTTLCWMRTYNQGLIARQFQGQISINLGIEKDPDMGPNGLEGVHGWGISEASYSSCTVEVTVPFDDDWLNDFRVGNHKHMLIQVGTQPALAHGIYFPRLAWAAEPKRVNNNGRVSLTLSFKAVETDPNYVLTTDAQRAKFHVFRVANAPAP